MDIIKKNIEMAKYMGFEDRGKYITNGGNFMESKQPTLENGVKVYRKIKYEDLDFHINFNSLMEVVEKIESQTQLMIEFWILPTEVKVFISEENIFIEDEGTKIENLHQAVSGIIEVISKY